MRAGAHPQPITHTHTRRRASILASANRVTTLAEAHPHCPTRLPVDVHQRAHQVAPQYTSTPAHSPGGASAHQRAHQVAPQHTSTPARSPAHTPGGASAQHRTHQVAPQHTSVHTRWRLSTPAHQRAHQRTHQVAPQHIPLLHGAAVGQRQLVQLRPVLEQQALQLAYLQAGRRGGQRRGFDT